MTAAVAGGVGGGLIGGMEEGRAGGVSSIPGGSTSEGVTPLMYACQQGRDHTVRQILHRKPTSVQERDRTGKTALHYCAENHTLACIDQVVEADPSLLQARDEDGYTPLHLATIAGNKSVVKYLLSKGSDVQALDNEKHTVVHWATVCGEVELLDLLIESGADPSTPDIHGAFPLHYAAQMCGPNSEMGNDVRVGLLVLRKLLQHGVHVSVTDHDGRQPLLWAASAGNPFESRSNLLSAQGAVIKTGKPLNGSADAILALVNAGASVSAEDKDGLTALHCAASRGHLDCLDCLLSLCGAEVDTLDSNGCTPLFYAVTLGHADCTQLLLNHSAHPDRQDRKGRTPAHCGAAKGQLETLKLLHKRGADLWKKNVKGDLPLHEACQSGRKDLVMWLLSMRPDTVNAPNLDGRCPLHIAAINNNIEMCKILMDQQAGVNPIMRNSRGQLLTPLDAAVARSNRGCAKYLQLHGGVTASKLTDKHALQKAMQRALETSHHGSTGATPTDYTGDELMSSSASSVLKSNRSTMTASPINIEAQTDTGDLKNGSKDDEDSKKPEQRDAQTGTSEVNIRKLVLEEEAELVRKKAQEDAIKEEGKEELENQDAEMQNGNGEETEGTAGAESQAGSEKESESAKESLKSQSGSEKGEKDGDNEGGEDSEQKKTKKGKSKGSTRENSKDSANVNADGEKDGDNEDGEDSEQKKVKKGKSKGSTRENSKDGANANGDGEVVDEETTETRVDEEGAVIEEVITKTVRDDPLKSTYANIPEHFGEDEVSEEKQNGDGDDIGEETGEAKKSREASVEQGVESQGEGGGERGHHKGEKVDGKGMSSTTGHKNSKGDVEDGDERDDGSDGSDHQSSQDSKRSHRRKEKRSKMVQRESVSLVGDGDEGEEMEISENGEVRIRAGGLENGEADYDGYDGSDNENGEHDDDMEYSEGEGTGNEEEEDDEDMEASDGEYLSGEYGKQTSDGAVPRGRPKSAAQPGMSKGQGKQNQKGGNGKQASTGNGSKGKSKTKGKGQKNKSKSKTGSTNKARSTRRVSISERPEEYDADETQSGIPGKPPLAASDERTHELMLESSGRDFLMVNDGAPARLSSSPSSTHGRDTGDSGFKESGFSDYLGPDRDSDVDGPTDPERHTDDEDIQHLTKRKTRTRRHRNKQREERLVGGALSEDAEERTGGRKSAGSTQGEDGDEEKPLRRRKDSRNRRSPNNRGSDDDDDGGGGDSEDAGDVNGDDEADAGEDGLRLGVPGHRRPGVRRGQARSGAMSGGPEKVQNMDSNLRRKPKKSPNASTEMSITQAMQTTMRKYALERRLFQQLLELKRLQIRNTRANEHVLIKRMVDAYMKEGNQLGLRGYSGAYNFPSYEKYLYDQLRFLQSSQGTKIPTFRPSDDVEKLSRAIRRAEIIDLPDTLMTPRDPYECNHTTHRCHHAAHAYTGVPCAAYLGHRNRRKNKSFSLPRIAGTSNANSGGTSLRGSPGPPGGGGSTSRASEPIGLRNYDPKKPLTVELQHGQARQQITLPTEILDKSKKYHLTFTIKPSSPTKGSSESPEEVEPVVERSASAPEAIDADTLPIDPRPEPHSAPPEGRTAEA